MIEEYRELENKRTLLNGKLKTIKDKIIEYFKEELKLPENNWVEVDVKINDSIIYIEIRNCREGADYGTAYRTTILTLSLYKDKTIVNQVDALDLRDIHKYCNKIREITGVDIDE